MLGKNMNLSQKWVVMISAKRIIDKDKDEKQLSQHMLPPWMSLDVMYYFELGEKDDAPPKGFIVTQQIHDVFNEQDQIEE